MRNINFKEAYLAGGCFWCIGNHYENLHGVKDVVSGFSGGIEINPTYELVKSQKTLFRETIKIIYDEDVISYETLIKEFLSITDPFDKNGQFGDNGFSYTLAIFYQDEKEKTISQKIINLFEKSCKKQTFIDVLPFNTFYKADDYHQHFGKKNPKELEDELISSGRKK